MKKKNNFQHLNWDRDQTRNLLAALSISLKHFKFSVKKKYFVFFESVVLNSSSVTDVNENKKKIDRNNFFLFIKKSDKNFCEKNGFKIWRHELHRELWNFSKRLIENFVQHFVLLGSLLKIILLQKRVVLIILLSLKV